MPKKVIILKNTGEAPVPYACIDKGPNPDPTRPGLLQPDDTMEGFAISYNASQWVIALYTQFSTYHFTMDGDLQHEVLEKE